MEDTLNNTNSNNEGGKRWHFNVSDIDAGTAVETAAKPDESDKADKADVTDKTDVIDKPNTPTKEDEPQQEEGQERVTIGKLLRNRALRGKMLRKYVPWMMMIVGLFLLLIYNRYAIEGYVKEKNETQEKIKYLREHKIQMQKKYQESTKISKIAEELDTLKIGLLSGPPYELETVKDND